jgi:hypothetical protein
VKKTSREVKQHFAEIVGQRLHWRKHLEIVRATTTYVVVVAAVEVVVAVVPVTFIKLWPSYLSNASSVWTQPYFSGWTCHLKYFSPEECSKFTLNKYLSLNHGRPQTFFQARVKFSGGGDGQKLLIYLKNKKETIFPQKV